MALLYEIDSIDQGMRKDLMTVTCANLNDQEINYTSGQYKFKIFMETVEDVPELYINFDFTNNLIELAEKDVEYREGVLSYMEEK
jgi:hypothetical protein